MESIGSTGRLRTYARVHAATPAGLSGIASDGSFGGQEEAVVRLAAVVHVELELRVLRRHLVEEAVERRRVLAAQDGEHVARLGEEVLEQRASHLGEALAGGDGGAIEEREVVALPNRDTVRRRVAGGGGDLAG